jgi:hypothetical protein
MQVRRLDARRRSRLGEFIQDAAVRRIHPPAALFTQSLELLFQPLQLTDAHRDVANVLVGAGYHTALVAGWVPPWWIPCGAGPSCSELKLVILGDIQIPWLSLLAFAALVAMLLIYLRRTRP